MRVRGRFLTKERANEQADRRAACGLRLRLWLRLLAVTLFRLCTGRQQLLLRSTSRSASLHKAPARATRASIGT